MLLHRRRGGGGRGGGRSGSGLLVEALDELRLVLRCDEVGQPRVPHRVQADADSPDDQQLREEGDQRDDWTAAVWVPLGIAIGVGTSALSRPAPVPATGSPTPHWFTRTLRIRFSATDIFWGIAIAFVCRTVDAFLSIGFFGTTGFGGQASVDGGPPVGELVLLIVGTCLITPVIEELFFRGLLLQWLLRRASAAGEGRGGVIASVLISAVVFGIMHVLVAQTTMLGDVVEFLSTFLLGLLVAAVVARTGRLGTALVAHVLFNALAVALTWP